MNPRAVIDQILRTEKADVLRGLVALSLKLSKASQALLIADGQRLLTTTSLSWSVDIEAWPHFDCASKYCQLRLCLFPDAPDPAYSTDVVAALALQIGSLLDSYCDAHQLKIEHQRLQQAFAVSGAGAWRMDVASGVFEGDAMVASLLGLTADRVQQDFAAIVDLIDPRERAGFLYGISRGTNLEQRQRQVFQLQASGRWVLAIFERDASDSERLCFVGVMHDHSAQREAELEVEMHQQQLESLVKNLRKSNRIDALTGLSNRVAFNESMQSWTVSARAKGGWISLLMIDVDHFKAYNDSYGHDQGDVALQCVAQAIEQCARGADLPARFGGEEFCYLTLSDPELAEKVAERIRLAVENSYWPLRQVTVSIGICSLQGSGIDSTTLFKRADEALYAAKSQGRNRWVFATSEA
jgi:diguanylate cyclase (GGDEF)-like protein